MARKSTRNNKLLFNSKDITSPKVYSILVNLVNEDREDLAEEVLKVDYLLQYASTCIKQKDNSEARETLEKAWTRIENIKSQGFEVEHLEHLYSGVEGKCRK
ncbi:hypothetical protein [Clostridium polynesiense]|uniref:hypothetical protein n=1 Tax=Clostridium polynesiense TaxID=1325933 RepID=UPI00058FB9BF|nr:hypothetical protein [Clostridium polynesiense]